MLRKICHKLPKIELHAHLSGCIRVPTLLAMAKEKKIDTTILEKNERSHENSLHFFKTAHQVIDSKSALKRITLEMIEDFRQENTMYLEIRTTLKNLKDFETQEITVPKASYLETVLEAID